MPITTAPKKKGCSGVALFCKRQPEDIAFGFSNKEFDAEGRVVRADFGKLSVISVYLPSGSSSEERQQAKFRFLKHFMLVLRKLRADGREYIICGD